MIPVSEDLLKRTVWAIATAINPESDRFVIWEREGWMRAYTLAGGLIAEQKAVSYVTPAETERWNRESVRRFATTGDWFHRPDLEED